MNDETFTDDEERAILAMLTTMGHRLSPPRMRPLQARLWRQQVTAAAQTVLRDLAERPGLFSRVYHGEH